MGIGKYRIKHHHHYIDDDDEFPNSFYLDYLLSEFNRQSSSSSCYENGPINPTIESEEEEDFDSSNIQIVICW